MKINLTKKQYQELLKMAFCGNWVVNARFTDKDSEYQKDHDDLYRYLKTFAKDFGLDDWVLFAEDLNQYFLTQKKEFELHEFVADYDDYVFWEELETRLVEREFDQTYSEEIQAQMSLEERITKMRLIEAKYGKEFYENGIDNLYMNFLSTKN